MGLRVRSKITWALCCWPPGPLARRERGAYPQRYSPSEQQSQWACGPQPEGARRRAGIGALDCRFLDDALWHRHRRSVLHLPARRSRQSAQVISERTLKKLAVMLALLVGVSDGHAASAGSKNKQGNRLFEQGKYEDAQKAYLEAQAESPDRPEPLYNLGNTLIKQKKYEQAVQSLRQSVSKGDKGLQASSWFNVGNALFEMGNFNESIQAYIQSLRINPIDRDAKHNLELALRKLAEQKQQKPQNQNQNSKENRPKSQDSSEDQQTGTKDQQQPPKQDKQQADNSQPQQDPKQPANPQSTQAERREGTFSKEQALQILDALQNQELADQLKLLERRARRKATGKDW